MNQNDIISKINLLCIKLGRPVNKKDINKQNGFDFSYSTLVNKGILLRDIKFNQILYNDKPNKCSNCEKFLLYKQRHNKYCSSSCAAKTNNTLSPKRISKYKEKECKCCLKSIKTKEDFCEMKCRNDFLYMERFLEWYYNAGDFSGSALLIKGYITMMVGYKCSECGISTYNDKPLTLHLEHKDGNAINNSKENLCLLCPNCHALTPTYGARNIGNGKRTWRNERYKQGKSY